MCLVGEKATWGEDGKKQVTDTLIDGQSYRKLFKRDDWNDVVIIAKGNHLQHYLNGTLILDCTDIHGRCTTTTRSLPMKFWKRPLLVCCALGWCFVAPLAVTAAQAEGPVKVFILAGQSNMEGHGNVELTEPAIEHMKRNNTYERDKNNYLDYLAKHSDRKDKYKHLLDEHGQWAKRDDVWFIWQRTGRDGGEIKSKLTVGLGASGSPKIGPELQFGQIMGDYFQEPVLLIKTAWGGKSLAVDFRPPSAGLPPVEELKARLDRINENNEKNNRDPLTMEQMKSSYGHYYRLMISEVNETLKNVKSKFPEYGESQGYEITGFVWFQGWNDGQSVEFASEYTENFKHLVHDIRKEYGPISVVIGSSGFGKNAPSRNDGWVNRLREHVEPAQIAAAKQLDNVECFETGDCLIPHEDRTSNRGIHHWFNSAETYFLIGKGLGNTMKSLLD